MLKVDLLEEKELWGESALEVIKQHGTKAKATDIAIASGSSSLEIYYYTKTPYFMKKTDRPLQITIVNPDGNKTFGRINIGIYGVRPVITFSSLSEITSQEIKADGTVIADKLEYITEVADNRLSSLLNRAQQRGYATKTGKKYSIPMNGGWSYQTVQAVDEISYNGKKYAALESCIPSKEEILSNGSEIHDKEILWAIVTPITGFVSGNKFIFKDIVFSMPFNDIGNKDYEESSLKRFLENHFLQDLIPSGIYSTPNMSYNTEDITSTLLTLNTELESIKSNINILQKNIGDCLIQLSNVSNNQEELSEKNPSLVKKI